MINHEIGRRFSSLTHLQLWKFEKDELVSPKESSWFGYVDEMNRAVEMNETILYREDLIGLRELVGRGRVEFVRKNSRHLKFDWNEFVRLTY